MEKEKSKVVTIILRVVKIVLLVLGLAAFVGLMTHFALGIRDSVHGDDIITAQDRVAGAHQFMRMILCGLITLAFVLPTIAIKVPILPEKVSEFLKNKVFKKKEKPQPTNEVVEEKQQE